MKQLWTVCRIDDGYWDFAILGVCGKIKWTEEEDDATKFPTEKEAKEVIKLLDALDKITRKLEPKCDKILWHYTWDEYEEAHSESKNTKRKTP